MMNPDFLKSLKLENTVKTLFCKVFLIKIYIKMYEIYSSKYKNCQLS